MNPVHAAVLQPRQNRYAVGTDTILRWHRQLVIQQGDDSELRKPFTKAGQQQAVGVV